MGQASRIGDEKVMRFLMLLLLTFLLTGGAYSFPQVENWKNSPIVVYDNKQQAILKKDLILKAPFAVVTANNDQIEFKINTFDKIVVYQKTKVQILEFLNENGFVSDLYILDGVIRFTSIHRGLGANEQFVTIKTPFFDIKASGLYDFIISLDMKEPSVEVKMISGVLPLEFFAYEKKLNLKAGEKVKFKGVMSDDGAGIKYDYLLNKRKVPKGALLEVMNFDQSSFLKAEKDLAQAEMKKIKELKRKKEALKQKKKEYEDSFLCKKPFGHKNQCAWWLEAGKCYRKRCNVSGEWGDLIERPITSLCKKDFTVAECDY